jgi:isoleucyl-tRNA synthetase
LNRPPLRTLPAIVEIIFEVREDEADGGYVATARGHAIATQGETMDELRDMPSDNANAARNLARFYIRIANLRARILNELQQMQQAEQSEQSEQSEHSEHSEHSEQLQRAYATELGNMRNKQRENREHFARIMQTIISDPESEQGRVHPDLTDAALDALELQVHDIMERGCTSNQLRCIKIREAAMEQRIYDALIAELNALNA